MFFLTIGFGAHGVWQVQLWASKDREENLVLQDPKLYIRDRQTDMKVTQGQNAYSPAEGKRWNEWKNYP